MALPVGNNQNNKELELVASLLEKTLKELEETKQSFEEFKKQSEEKEKKFTDFANNVIKTLNEKEFNPKIEVKPTSVYLNEGIIATKIVDHTKKMIEPPDFWGFTKLEYWNVIQSFIFIVLLIFSFTFNFKQSYKFNKITTARLQAINQFQEELYRVQRGESKFWFSKTHQKAFSKTVVDGELNKAMKRDELEYQDKLKAEKGKFKLNK